MAANLDAIGGGRCGCCCGAFPAFCNDFFDCSVRIKTVVKKYLESTKGAFNYIGTIRKSVALLELHGVKVFHFTLAQFSGFLSIVCFPRAITTSIELGKYAYDVATGNYRDSIPQCIDDGMYKGFDCAASYAFTAALFGGSLFLNAAIICLLVKDVADVFGNGMKLVKHMSEDHPLQERVQRVTVFLLKLCKAVAAVAGGVFACYLMATGLALAPVLVVTLVALSNTVFAMAADLLDSWFRQPAQPRVVV